MMRWREFLPGEMWESTLARLEGHPLQSLFWGNARQRIDNIQQLLLVYEEVEGQVAGLARVEMRSVPFIGRVAWIPKGPVLKVGEEDRATLLLCSELNKRGYVACIYDLYCHAGGCAEAKPKTIWLDLTQGIETLSSNLDSQWRYGARRAIREGVNIRIASDPSEVMQFYRMCEQLSDIKRFELPCSEKLMMELLCSDLPSSSVGMSLYIGEVNGRLASGAVVAQCGSHLHYFWGASNREFSKYRVSEAVQWQIIQDGVAAGMTRYDLEGIDPEGNPGVYQFKKKMGGTEVTLQGHHVVPLTLAGRLAVNVGRCLGRL